MVFHVVDETALLRLCNRLAEDERAHAILRAKGYSGTSCCPTSWRAGAERPLMVCGTESRHERGYDSAWVKVRNQVIERMKASANAASAPAASPWPAWSTTSSARSRPPSCAGHMPRPITLPTWKPSVIHAMPLRPRRSRGKRKRVKRAAADGWPV
jgi:hypothetical protein